MGVLVIAGGASVYNYVKTRKYMKGDPKDVALDTMSQYMAESIEKTANDWVKNKDGYKISPSISTVELEDQRDTIQTIANEEGAKRIKKTYELNNRFKTKFPKELKEHLEQWKKGTLGSLEFRDLFDYTFKAQVNHIIAQLMTEELILRQKFQKKIEANLTSTNMNLLESLKKEARSPEQVNEIQSRIDALKEEEARKKAVADAEKKLAEAKTEEEKKQAQAELDTLINQGSKAVGAIAKTTGISKGALYIGIGVAVVIAGVLIYRGIRK
jgi:hypothetical protein